MTAVLEVERPLPFTGDPLADLRTAQAELQIVEADRALLLEELDDAIAEARDEGHTWSNIGRITGLHRPALLLAYKRARRAEL